MTVKNNKYSKISKQEIEKSLLGIMNQQKPNQKNTTLCIPFPEVFPQALIGFTELYNIHIPDEDIKKISLIGTIDGIASILYDYIETEKVKQIVEEIKKEKYDSKFRSFFSFIKIKEGYIHNYVDTDKGKTLYGIIGRTVSVLKNFTEENNSKKRQACERIVKDSLLTIERNKEFLRHIGFDTQRISLVAKQILGEKTL